MRMRPVLASLALAFLGACASKPEPIPVGRPDRQLYASERFGALEVVLDEPLPVRSVMAAAEAALRDRGYTVTTRRTTDEAGHIVARAPSRELGRTWKVQTRATPSGRTTLSVEPGGFDNQDGAEVMMDAILQRLGR